MLHQQHPVSVSNIGETGCEVQSNCVKQPIQIFTLFSDGFHADDADLIELKTLEYAKVNLPRVILFLWPRMMPLNERQMMLTQLESCKPIGN